MSNVQFVSRLLLTTQLTGGDTYWPLWN